MTKFRNIFINLRSYSAIKIAVIYFFVSFLWIFFSDRLLQLLARNYEILTQFQTLKGCFFITVSTLLIYYLIRREIRKKNEIISTINESESWYNTLLSNIPKVDVFLFDMKMTFILAQGKQVLNFGLNPDEMRGKSFNNLKIDETINFMLKENFARILIGESVVKEFMYHDEWYELRGAPVIGDRDNILAGIAIFINITQQKKNINELIKHKNEFESLYMNYQALNNELEESNKNLMLSNQQLAESEEKYRTFINQTTEGVYRMDFYRPLSVDLPVEEQIKHIYTYSYLAECNHAFARMYGFEKTEELTGKSLTDFHGSDNIPENIANVRKFITSGYRLVNSESLEKDRTGELKYFSNNIIGIINDGFMIRMWGTQSDITQRKKYEQELILARKKAEESDKLKSAFLANISHEVRTPLNGIMGFSELLVRNDNKPEKISQYTNVIKKSSQQLLNIINDILDISLLESNELKLTATKFSLNELMDELHYFYKHYPEIDEKKLKLRYVKFLSQGNDIIIADRIRINQIMLNLINNAVKFTNCGYVEFGYLPDNENKLKFYVKDSGIGIPLKNQNVIFERFRQLDFELSRKYGGTGLGLTIVKKLVELMGGDIRIRSSEETGSAFFFTLSYQLPKDSRQVIMENNTPYLKGHSILVITEDEKFRKYTDDISQQASLYLYHADTGAHAIDICMNNSKIDLVLLDVQLTDFDVTDLTIAIKKIKPGLPLVFLTNNINERTKQNYFNAGCDDFISKTLEKNTLSELMIRFSNFYT